MKTIGIVGLGLIGGSFAAAAVAGTDCRVLGQDLNSQAEETALSRGWIQERLENRLELCDLLVLALYPQTSVEFIRTYADRIRRDALVMDLCGVKRVVTHPLRELARQYGFTYVGGHPMAGREFSGIDYADGTLFRGAAMILTPEEETPPQVLETLKTLALSLGFGSVTITTDLHHDQVIAYTSQLAHVLSSAYVKSPRALEHRGFSAGSFRDLTRVARLNEVMWTELFLENRDCLLEELDRVLAHLQEYRRALAAEDAETLRSLLRDGRIQKEQSDTLEKEER